ncbi:bifunctional metallophosphatase/5'-nucleotidase [Desemzia sp. RIT804]|uniref:bifunctional metallophosphatase/5'-nucleotidase n=1 Tax=Desemzia sp. RIT 804 TaxID=2810209 RepID=UPI0019506709|nr:bifunctional UDP-sugar hydrolase/5'-nucleotidase [Desemzia sp. RIT 804]MBM6615775.1 bifunctional metallophosphatase/5'-nucleotidase [Desemzia sp. RIT 804]
MERIHLYHTNDIHSHLSKWPRISQYLRNERKRVEENGETFFSFDIGDACDRVHPLIEATNGTAMIHLMNEVHYDAVTIGNNEGIGSSKEQLNHLYDSANFKTVISNMFDTKTGETPNGTVPFQILKTKNGHRLGVFGLTAQFPTSYVPLGWAIKDPFDVISDMLEILAPLADSIILLSHLGIGADRKIGEMYPMIDIILGSHTHHVLPEGEKVRNTLLGAAGRYGEYIGHIVLELDDAVIDRSVASVIPTEEAPAPSNEKELIENYEMKGQELLKEQQIADLPTSLPVSWYQDSELVQISLEAVKYYAKTDAAVLNAGLFMTSLDKGIVTNDELHKMLPHPMRILRVTLNGTELIRVVREMEKNRGYLRKFPIRGMGFRGEYFGEILYNGLSFDASTGEVLWQGKEVVLDQRYTFATVDHFMYIPFFPTIELEGENELIFPLFIRNVVGQYLKKNYPIV